jgi:PST family polysaccharide transporter
VLETTPPGAEGEGAGAPTAPSGGDRRAGITDLRRHTARGMLINSGFQVGMFALGAVRGIFVAAFLTQSDYGVWGLIGLTMWTALGFKYVFGAGDKFVQQSEADQEGAFRRAFTVEVVFAAVCAPIAAVVVVVFALVTGKSSILAPGMVMLLLLPATALQFPLAVFYRRMDYRRQRTLQAIDPVLATVVTFALAIAGAGYWSFVVGAVVGASAAAMAAVRVSPYRLALEFDRSTLRTYAGFSAPLLVAGYAGLALFEVIYLVGSHPLGLAGLGVFTLVGNIVQFTDQADTIVTDTLYPAICTVADRIEALSEIFVKSNRLSLMWAVPFGVGVSVFALDLVHFVLGRHWLAAIGLLEIMGVVTALNHVGYNWTAFVRARGRTGPIAVVAVITSTATAVAAVPLMYTHGLLGLGWAFAAGAVVALVVRSVIMARFFAGAAFLPQLLRGFLPAVVGATPVLLLRATLGTETSLGAGVLLVILFVVLTGVTTYLLERPLLNEALGYMLPRLRGRRAGLPDDAAVA